MISQKQLLKRNVFFILDIGISTGNILLPVHFQSNLLCVLYMSTQYIVDNLS